METAGLPCGCQLGLRPPEALLDGGQRVLRLADAEFHAAPLRHLGCGLGVSELHQQLRQTDVLLRRLAGTWRARRIIQAAATWLTCDTRISATRSRSASRSVSFSISTQHTHARTHARTRQRGRHRPPTQQGPRARAQSVGVHAPCPTPHACCCCVPTERSLQGKNGRRHRSIEVVSGAYWGSLWVA
jgi:hypothetical protein